MMNMKLVKSGGTVIPLIGTVQGNQITVDGNPLLALAVGDTIEVAIAPGQTDKYVVTYFSMMPHADGFGSTWKITVQKP